MVDLIGKKLGIERCDFHIGFITGNPKERIVFRVYVGCLVAVISRGKFRIQWQCIFESRLLCRTERQLRQPVFHIRKIYGDGTVGHILQFKIIGNVIIGVLRGNIAVGFSGNQCVLIPILCFRFSVGRKGHHNTVAVYHLNGYIPIRKEGQGLAFAGLDGQGIGVGISACGNLNFDIGYLTHRNRNTIFHCLPIYCNGVILFQSYGAD